MFFYISLIRRESYINSVFFGYYTGISAVEILIFLGSNATIRYLIAKPLEE